MRSTGLDATAGSDKPIARIFAASVRRSAFSRMTRYCVADDARREIHAGGASDQATPAKRIGSRIPDNADQLNRATGIRTAGKKRNAPSATQPVQQPASWQ